MATGQDSHAVAREACVDGGLRSQRKIANRLRPSKTSCPNPTVQRDYASSKRSKGHSPVDNRLTHVEGSNLPLSAGTIHGRSSLNGSSHPDLFLAPTTPATASFCAFLRFFAANKIGCVKTNLPLGAGRVLWFRLAYP